MANKVYYKVLNNGSEAPDMSSACQNKEHSKMSSEFPMGTIWADEVKVLAKVWDYNNE